MENKSIPVIKETVTEDVTVFNVAKQDKQYRLFITPKEACRRLGLSYNTMLNLVHDYRNSKFIFRVGRSWRIDFEQFIRYIRNEI